MKTQKIFKFTQRCLSISVLIFLLAACTDKQLEFSGTGSNISGSIAGFSALSAKPSQSVSAFSCTTPQAEIYSLDAYGVRSTTALSTTPIAADGTFTFKNVTSLGVDLQSSKVKYIIAISGCTDPLSRPLTDRKKQDISWGSTLVEKVSLVEYSGKKTLSETQKTEILDLITKLNGLSGSSLDDIFNNVLSNPTVSTGFQTIFQLPATQLQYSQPTVNTFNAPSSVNELSTAGFSVSASHWHPSYTVAYIWKLDGSQVSTSANYNYTPSKTSQGLHTVQLFIGKSDGSGGIDLTKAYVTKSFSLTVNDTYYPVPPALTLATSSPTNSQNVTLSMNTGAGFVNCDSFSTLALTEDSPTAPILASAYNMTCTSAGSQNINYTLTSSEGIHTLRLWARDSSGNISPTPSAVNIVLDTTAPVVSISSQPTDPTNSTSASFSFAATDANAIDYYECKLDAGSYAACTSPKSYTGLSAGSHTFSVRAIDVADNTSTAATHAWNIDLVAPTVAITTPASNGTFVPTASLSSFTVSGTCSEDTRYVQIAGSISGSATCSSGAWSASLNLSSLTDGTLSITATHTDAATNSTTTAARTFIKDTVLPSIAVATPSATRGNGAYGNASWTLTEANIAASTNFTVEVYTGSSWVSVATPSVTSGDNSNQSYSLTNYSVPSADTTVAKVRVSVTDAAGNLAQAQSGNFIIDSTAPTLSNLIANLGASSTSSSNIPLSFDATDSLKEVQSLCIKLVNSAPSSSDSCWTPVASYGVTPAGTVSLSSIYYNVGFASGSFEFYVWVRDSLGNSSTLSSSGAGTVGVDKSSSITYVVPSPPDINSFQVTGTDSPSSPPTSGELTVTSGGTIYLKWQISASAAISSISILYSTDDNTYTSLTSGLTNGVNGSCTLSGSYTGCAALIAPTSSYFRLKIVVTDANSSIKQTTSNALNSASVRFLAGNTDLGLGGSAKAAVLKPTSNNALAVLNDGRMFVADERGLSWVNPTNGKYEILVPSTGTRSGDGGNISGATLGSASAVYADFQGHLLVVDGNIIRKINTQTNPMTISRFIGGGSDTSDTIASALDYSAPSFSTLYLISNGDIWFHAESPSKARIYKASTGGIVSLQMSGTGNSFSSTQDVLSCPAQTFAVSFDANSTIDHLMLRGASTKDWVTGALGTCGHGHTHEWQTLANINPTTGVAFTPAPSTVCNQACSQGVASGYREYYIYHLSKAGDIYAFYPNAGVSNRIFKFNKTTQGWGIFAGTGQPGSCADGTLASNCALSASSISLNAQGQFFYIDRYGKAIRTIDSDGKIRTLAGDKLGSDDGTDALTSRFVSLSDIKIWRDGATDKILAFDYGNSRLREFTPGGALATFAGNEVCGVPDTTNPANVQSIRTCHDGNPNAIRLDGSTGDVYFSRTGGKLSKISRTTGLWSDISSGHSYGAHILGMNTQYFLTGIFEAGGSNPKILLTRRDNGTNTEIVSNGFNAHATFCADGISLLSCNTVPPEILEESGRFDSVTNKWVLFEPNSSGRLVTFNEDGTGTMGTLVTLPRQVRGFDLNRSADLTSNFAYYCGTNGLLYKYNINTSTETALALPVSSMVCQGRVEYSSLRNSLLFIYSQNGLHGIAEYVNP